METAVQWLLGMVIALGIGHYGVDWFLRWLRGSMGLTKKPGGEGPRVPPWLMGLIERFFFTLAVAFELQGAGVAMIAWLGAKMAANWSRPGAQQSDEERRIQIGFAMSALLAGLLSMAFALIGGLIAGGEIW